MYRNIDIDIDIDMCIKNVCVYGWVGGWVLVGVCG